MQQRGNVGCNVAAWSDFGPTSTVTADDWLTHCRSLSLPVTFVSHAASPSRTVSGRHSATHSIILWNVILGTTKCTISTNSRCRAFRCCRYRFGRSPSFVVVVVVVVVRRSSFVVRRSSFVVRRSSFVVRCHSSPLLIVVRRYRRRRHRPWSPSSSLLGLCGCCCRRRCDVRLCVRLSFVVIVAVIVAVIVDNDCLLVMSLLVVFVPRSSCCSFLASFCRCLPSSSSSLICRSRGCRCSCCCSDAEVHCRLLVESCCALKITLSNNFAVLHT